MGEFAYQLFKRTLECEFTILYTDILFEEIQDAMGLKKYECYKNFFQELKRSGKLLKVHETQQDINEVYSLVKKERTPFKDAYHLVVSKNNDAILVSRNYHMLSCQDFNVVKPEEL